MTNDEEVTLEELAPIPGQITVEEALAESRGGDPEDVSTTKEKESSGGRRSS